MSAGTIVKKIQTLEDALESLRQQLVFTRSEEESVAVTKKEAKKPKEAKQPKQPKEKMRVKRIILKHWVKLKT